MLCNCLTSRFLNAMLNDELVNISHARPCYLARFCVNVGVWFHKLIESYLYLYLYVEPDSTGKVRVAEPDSNIGWNQTPVDSLLRLWKTRVIPWSLLPL